MWRLRYRPKKKADGQRKSTLRVQIPTLSSLVKKLDRIFSEYIRKLYRNDHGEVQCVTCGTWKPWKEMDAGHYIDRTHLSLRFSEKNVHPQCRKCNRFQNGRLPDYALFLIVKYGKTILEELDYKKRKITRFTTKDLELLIYDYVKKLKKLDDDFKGTKKDGS